MDKGTSLHDYRRIGATLAALALLAVSGRAQQVWGIYGTVNNLLTGERLVDVQVQLLRPDSTVLMTDTTMADKGVFDRDRVFFFMRPPKAGGDYLLRVQKEGYATTYFPLHVPAFNGRRHVLCFAGDLKLQRRRERELKGATVHATRIKFYHRGDTLVYNADAFQLSEGSMLDALIRQLPGAELKDDGRILVNGRQIETLTLNGKDFFKGNNRVMLDNLPAYTVKTVKVYDRAGRLSQFVGHDMGDKAYAMDVTLKKQYQTGWLGNVEAGGGSQERWLARLFALRFTQQSRLTFYANMNNLNDNRKPGENTEWSMDKMPRGLLTNRTGGLDYLVNDRRNRYELQGNVNLSHSDADNRLATTTERFLTGGNSYGRTLSASSSHSLTVNTDHNLSFNLGEHARMDVIPALTYNRYRSRSAGSSATMSNAMQQVSMRAFMDSLGRPVLPSAWLGMVNNRSVSRAMSDGHNLAGHMTVQQYFKLPGTIDIVEWLAKVNFSHSDDDAWSNRLVDYPADAARPTDYRRRYERSHPNRGWGYEVGASYIYCLPNNMLFTFLYKANQQFSNNMRDIFRLDSLSGWGLTDDHPLGARPADAAMMQSVLDTWNSYRMRGNNLTHTPGLDFNWQDYGQQAGAHWSVEVNLPLEVQSRRMHYRRATFNGLVRRNAVFFNPRMVAEYSWNNRQSKVRWQYAYQSALPSLLSLIEVPSTLDPLSTSTGNASLHASHSHSASLRWTHNPTRTQRQFSAGVAATQTDGQVVTAAYYNPADGSYFFRPENVNNRQQLSGDVGVTLPLTKNKRLTLSSTSFGQLLRQPALSGTAGVDPAPVKTTGRTYWVTENLRLKYAIKQFTAELSGYGSWNRTHNSNSALSTGNVWDYHYGLDLRARLPWAVELLTDFKVYGRRGYAVSSLNDDNLVWNARLQKTITAAHLTLAVDAFDILGRLKNVQQILTAEQHSETRYNAIPRYVMGHVIYRFHIAPKNKQP